jgi:hypothetical protein
VNNAFDRNLEMKVQARSQLTFWRDIGLAIDGLHLKISTAYK